MKEISNTTVVIPNWLIWVALASWWASILSSSEILRGFIVGAMCQ